MRHPISYAVSVPLLLCLAGCPAKVDGFAVVPPGIDASSSMDAGTLLRDGDSHHDDRGLPEAALREDRPHVPTCIPRCTVGGPCGADDGCGGLCFGRCPNPETQVCFGGICDENSWCPASACDLYASVGCLEGETCYAEWDPEHEEIAGTFCEIPGFAREGQACTADTDCRAFQGCFAGKCRRYCCTSGILDDLPSGNCEFDGWCARLFDRVGFCLPYCSLHDQSACAPDQVCVIDADHEGVTYCMETTADPGGLGENCAAQNSCAHGLHCTDGICRTPCTPGEPACADGTTCTPHGAYFHVCR